MDNEEWLNEYIMADTGLIWRGSHNRMRPCYWNFAQFEKDILECCVYLISKVSKLSIAGRADPVRVARAISAVVSFRLFLFKKKKIFCFDSHAIYLAVSLCRIEWLIAKLPVFPLPRSILPMTMASSKETGRAITEAVKRPLNGRAACSSSRVTGTPNDPSSTGSAGCFPASLPQVPPPFRVIYRRRFLANTSKRFPLPKRAKIFRKWDLKFEWKMGRCWGKKKKKNR